MKVQKKNQSGFIVTIELLLLATVLVFGLVAGWAALRDSVLMELGDLSNSIGSLNQGYEIDSVVNANSSGSSAGTRFDDNFDSPGLVDFSSGDASSEYTLTDGSIEPVAAP